MVENLSQKFYSMSEDEQRAFLIRVMPAVCRLFRKDSRTMMEDMMPLCKEMISGCGGEMSGMMEMMRDSVRR